MMQYIKYNIVSLSIIFCSIGAQEIESSLTNNSTDDLNNTVEKIVGKAKNQNKF